jgi:hypothetical protein
MKVICIKECSYSFNRLDYYFNIGDQFELAKTQPIYFPTTSTKHKEDKINIVINFIDGKNYAVTVLQEDFVSLQEWRDNQLEKLI